MTTTIKKKLEAAAATVGELVKPEIDWAKKCKCSLGADPEFILSYKGAKVGARGIFGTGNSATAAGGIGTDGNADTGELRPKHAYSPKELVMNIQKVFAEACVKHPSLGNAEWNAGAHKFGHPIGGHIHFGVSEETWLSRNLTKAMDYFLMCLVMQIEPADEARTRKGTNYGRMSDLRRQEWGVEYRSPASWLHSPALALAVLSVAKHIVNQSMLQADFFSKYDFNKLMGGNSYDTVKTRYQKHDVAFFRQYREKMLSELESWPMEPAVKDGVEIMKTMIMKDYKFGRGDFKLNWGLEFKLAGSKIEGLVPADSIF